MDQREVSFGKERLVLAHKALGPSMQDNNKFKFIKNALDRVKRSWFIIVFLNPAYPAFSVDEAPWSLY